MTFLILTLFLVPAVIFLGILLHLSNEEMILGWAVAVFALTIFAWMPTLWESDLLGLLSKIAVFLFALLGILLIGFAFSFALHPQKEERPFDISR